MNDDIYNVGALVAPPERDTVGAQRVIIGCMIVSPLCISIVDKQISDSDITDPQLLVVFKVLLQLYEAHHAVDDKIVIAMLESSSHREMLPRNITMLVNKLMDLSCSLHSLPVYIHMIQKKKYLEAVENSVGNITNALYNVELATMNVGAFDQRLHGFMPVPPVDNKMVDALAIAQEQRAQMQYDREHGITPLKTGYPKIDSGFLGFIAGDVTLLPARPSVGKTAFAINIALNVQHKAPVLFVSLEMKAGRLMDRAIAITGPMEFSRINKNTVDLAEYERVAKLIDTREHKLHIHQPKTRNYEEVYADIEQLHAGHSYGLVIIDYLQLLSGDARDTRNIELGKISTELKMLALRNDVAVLCLAQLSRDIEKRMDKEPMNSDLRDSGQIEQDADNIMFLWMPDNQSSRDKYHEILIKKQRNGPLHRAPIRFHKHEQRFVNYEGDPPERQKRGSKKNLDAISLDDEF